METFGGCLGGGVSYMILHIGGGPKKQYLYLRYWKSGLKNCVSGGVRVYVKRTSGRDRGADLDGFSRRGYTWK